MLQHASPRLKRSLTAFASHRYQLAIVEGLELRTLLSSISQVEGIGYLPSDNGTVFQRYDIANEQWLAPVALSGSPGGITASLVDEDGIFVAYGTNVMRYGLDGSNPTPLMNVSTSVIGIHSDGDLLFLNHSSGSLGQIISINKSTNTILDATSSSMNSFHGSSISQEETGSSADGKELARGTSPMWSTTTAANSWEAATAHITASTAEAIKPGSSRLAKRWSMSPALRSLVPASCT